MTDWQPIETAPKDGGEVLMYSHGDIAVCYWSEDMMAWTWGLGREFKIPTHWMPLPEPPK